MTPTAAELVKNWIVLLLTIGLLLVAHFAPFWLASFIYSGVAGALVGPLTPWNPRR
jgi:hypothetical protein